METLSSLARSSKVNINTFDLLGGFAVRFIELAKKAAFGLAIEIVENLGHQLMGVALP